MGNEKSDSSAHKSFLERVGRILLPILTGLSSITGWRWRLIFIVIFIGYLVAKEFIKWYSHVFMGK